MNNKERIKFLIDQHARLDASTTELELKLKLSPQKVQLASHLAELKRKKLSIKDDLVELERSELEDQETFDFHNYDNS